MEKLIVANFQLTFLTLTVIIPSYMETNILRKNQGFFCFSYFHPPFHRTQH